jgi:hypothetical protein
VEYVKRLQLCAGLAKTNDECGVEAAVSGQIKERRLKTGAQPKGLPHRIDDLQAMRKLSGIGLNPPHEPGRSISVLS